MKKKCLNLGSGKDYIGSNEKEEWVNLDINDDWKVDVIWNLEKTPYPFKANTFDFVKAHDIFEHFDHEGVIKVINELKRIAKEENLIDVEAPYFTTPNAYGYHHKTQFHRDTFHPTIFPNVEVLKCEIIFSRSYPLKILNWFINKNQRIYERFFCYMLPSQVIRFQLKLKKDIKNKIR
ncbi:MAG: class I SAM-dependent methyltransferase [Nanoarchaeota archaeon]